jgi:hypothetical protein
MGNWAGPCPGRRRAGEHPRAFFFAAQVSTTTSSCRRDGVGSTSGSRPSSRRAGNFSQERSTAPGRAITIGRSADRPRRSRERHPGPDSQSLRRGRAASSDSCRRRNTTAGGKRLNYTAQENEQSYPRRWRTCCARMADDAEHALLMRTQGPQLRTRQAVRPTARPRASWELPADGRRSGQTGRGRTLSFHAVAAC